MFCGKCGNQHLSNAKFCTGCGHSIQTRNSKVIENTAVNNEQNPTNIESQLQETKVVNVNEKAKNGQNKCPKCGATEISFSDKKGSLRCHFCRHEFEQKTFEKQEDDISKLEGLVVGAGAQDIIFDAKDVLTFKCSSCSAEVIINTSEELQARCHWCRNTLSVNERIPNGAVPDMILPFQVKKEEAQEEIRKFVKKRKFFAHPKFKKEFCAENIKGVYLPYMVVDINASARYTGQGEITTKIRGSGKSTTYDADLYNVNREFDIEVDSLTIEASKEKLQHSSALKTNNIINAIMPFDTEKASLFNANYLKGYTSEKRTANIKELGHLVDDQVKDISRYSGNNTLTEYNRGVRWDEEVLNVKGKQWKAAFLPVWLYSYQSVSGGKKVLHYVAVNARTKKTMGSIPINKPKLLTISMIVQFIGTSIVLNFFWWLVIIDAADDIGDAAWFLLLLLAGFVFYGIFYSKYRNYCARHEHELDTKSRISNVRKNDTFVKGLKKQNDATIKGMNNQNVSNSRSSFTFGKNPFKGANLNATSKRIINSLDGQRILVKEHEKVDNPFKCASIYVCMILAMIAAGVVYFGFTMPDDRSYNARSTDNIDQRASRNVDLLHIFSNGLNSMSNIELFAPNSWVLSEDGSYIQRENGCRINSRIGMYFRGVTNINHIFNFSSMDINEESTMFINGVNWTVITLNLTDDVQRKIMYHQHADALYSLVFVGNHAEFRECSEDFEQIKETIRLN